MPEPVQGSQLCGFKNKRAYLKHQHAMYLILKNDNVELYLEEISTSLMKKKHQYRKKELKNKENKYVQKKKQNWK